MKNKIYRTVAIKERLPENDGRYITNIGAQRFEFIGKGWTRGLEDLESVEWWLEEIELPSEEELNETTDLEKGSSMWFHSQGFTQGVNFILNRIKK